MQAIVSVMLEHRRKDFLEMIVHHVTTLVVITCSFYAGHYRIGSIIMLLFDPADVPLHIAKQCKYIGGFAEKLADLFFVLFMLTFFVTRMVVYPYTVWSAQYVHPPFLCSVPLPDPSCSLLACC